MKRFPITIAVLPLLAAALAGRPAGATQFQRVTTDSTRESDPAPSPDGKWLAYSSDKGGSTQIWVMPIGGGHARRLTSEPDSVRVQDPDHPDSMRTIYVRAATPTWAPDSKSVLFISTRTGRFNIYSVPLAGGKPRRVSNAPGNHRYAVYSPNGKEIAFYSNRLQPDALFGFNIFVMDSGGETPDHLARQITNSTGSPGHPTWSPDGAWIAYVSKEIDPKKKIDVGKGMQMEQSAIFAAYKVYKAPAQGGRETRVGAGLVNGKDYEDTWPSWSPTDARWLAVARTLDGKRDVWVIDTTTGRSFPLTNTGTASKPTWTHDGKAIYFTAFEGRNEDVWVATDLTLRSPAPSQPAPPKRAARPVKKPTSGATTGKAAK
jgi:Tol biopolymer transport system component